MDEADTESAAFRPFKKRKVFRPRTRTSDDDRASQIEQQADLPQNEIEVDSRVASAEHESGVTMADILRRRQENKTRRRGIGFSKAEEQTPTETAAPGMQIALRDPASSYSTRFTKQTGQKIEVEDKHMLAYIDSKMASLRESQMHEAQMSTSDDPNGSALNSHNDAALLLAAPQTAATSRLQEIDLGADATLRNIQRTEAARRRLENGESVTDEPAPQKPRKPRLGRDGKPWRPRKRRNSDDIKRDAIVEALLRENKVDLFSPPTSPADPSSTLAGHDEAADERVAEQFKRDYMEQQMGNNRNNKPPVKKVPGRGVEDKTKGPKMGGSRNARALAAKEEAAKKK